MLMRTLDNSPVGKCSCVEGGNSCIIACFVYEITLLKTMYMLLDLLECSDGKYFWLLQTCKFQRVERPRMSYS